MDLTRLAVLSRQNNIIPISLKVKQGLAGMGEFHQHAFDMSLVNTQDTNLTLADCGTEKKGRASSILNQTKFKFSVIKVRVPL